MEKRAVSGLLLTLLFLSVLALAFNIEPVSSAVSPYIGVVPSSTVDPELTPGTNCTVSLYTDYDGNDVWGWQFELFFNPYVLEGLEVRNGDLITKAKDPRAHFFPGSFDNTLGHLDITVALFWFYRLPPPTTNGPGTLVYVTFRVKGTGISNLTLGEALIMGFQPSESFPHIIDQNEPPGATQPPYGSDHIQHGYFENVRSVSAAIGLDPATLNLYSKGKWITAYVELPEGYNAEDIDATTILLNETIQPGLDPKYDFATNSSEYLVDHDGDRVLERLVKFNRIEVGSWIYDDLGIEYGDVVVEITGELYDGTPFEGTDTIKVLLPGDADDDGDVDSNDLHVFSRCHGMGVENPSYNPSADFNEDGYINSEDLLILSENYGKTTV